MTTATAVAQRVWIKDFDEIGLEDIGSVGGMNASLGETYRELTLKGIRVPDGFAVTAAAYRFFLRENGLDVEQTSAEASERLRHQAQVNVAHYVSHPEQIGSPTGRTGYPGFSVSQTLNAVVIRLMPEFGAARMWVRETCGYGAVMKSLGSTKKRR